MIQCFIAKCNDIKLQRYYSKELLRYSIKSVFKVEIEDEAVMRNQYGKPSFKNNEHIKFNISHCDGLIACAVGLEEMGVDVENIRSFDDYVVIRVCNMKEINSIYNSDDSKRTFFTYWTMKESLGKALGVGLHYPLRENEFIKNGDGYLCNYEGLKIKNYEIDNKFSLSICTDKNQEIILKEVNLNGREFYRI